MPRQARLDFEGCLHHLINRGIELGNYSSIEWGTHGENSSGVAIGGGDAGPFREGFVCCAEVVSGIYGQSSGHAARGIVWRGAHESARGRVGGDEDAPG